MINKERFRMNREAATPVHDFSRWARLTESYAEEVEALRRHEPGASMRLMRIAHAMKQDPFGPNSPDSEHMPLPLRLAPPRPRSPTWQTQARRTLLRLRLHLRGLAARRAQGNATAPLA
jgi:hypothetical protein